MSRQANRAAALFPAAVARYMFAKQTGLSMRAILDVILLALQIYVWLLIAAAVLSWLIAFNVVNTRNQFVATVGEFLYRITEPALRPIRNMMPNLGGIDISPVILILIIFLIERVIVYYIYPSVALTWRRWSAAPDGVVIAVRLTPKGGRDSIDGIETMSDGRAVLKARVRAAPHEGAANEALAALLAKSLGVPPRSVEIVGGATSRIKRVHVVGEARRARRDAGETGGCALRKPHDRTHHRRQGNRGGTARARRRRGGPAQARPRHRARPRRRAGRRESGERRLCAHRRSKQTVEAGMHSFDHRLPETASENEVLALVEKLNADPAVHGILVQLPLPKQIDSQKVLNAIDPAKDVDGFHPVNAGGSRPACRRSRPARRSAASCWRRPCIARSRAWRRWWSAAPTSSASR